MGKQSLCCSGAGKIFGVRTLGQGLQEDKASSSQGAPILPMKLPLKLRGKDRKGDKNAQASSERWNGRGRVVRNKWLNIRGFNLRVLTFSCQSPCSSSVNHFRLP